MRNFAALLTLIGIFTLIACSSGTRVERVEPNFGNVAGNDDVIIIGDGFKAGMIVQFGKHEAKGMIIDSPTRMRVKSPSGTEGKVDVIITRDDGKTFVLKEGFSYQHDKTPNK